MLIEMIKFLYDMTTGTLFAILVYDFLMRQFPVQLSNMTLNVSYNCIYFYSKCQIFFVQYILSNPIISKAIDLATTNSTSLQKDLQYLFVNAKKNYITNVPIDSPDLIISTDYSKTPHLKKITYKGDYQDMNCEESDLRFILLEFTIGEKSYKINLLSKEFNYYIVGNAFNKDFLIFYIRHHLQQTCNYDDKCSLKIIDNCVIISTIDFTEKSECLRISCKDGYEITTI